MNDRKVNITNINTPQYARTGNNYTVTNDRSKCNEFDGSNNFGNYFQRCTQTAKSAYWGSHKPIPDNCMTPQVGQPCHSIWNNSTKRKTIVDYNRGKVVSNLPPLQLSKMPKVLVETMLPVKPQPLNETIKIAPVSCNCD